MAAEFRRRKAGTRSHFTAGAGQPHERYLREALASATWLLPNLGNERAARVQVCRGVRQNARMASRPCSPESERRAGFVAVLVGGAAMSVGIHVRGLVRIRS